MRLRKLLDALIFALQAAGVVLIASILAVPALLEKALEGKREKAHSSRET